MNLKLMIFVVFDMLFVTGVLFFLFGRDAQQDAAPASPVAAVPATPSEAARRQFLEAYRTAHRENNVDAAMRLICTDNVSQKTLNVLRDSLTDDFQRPFTSVDIVPLDDTDPVEYTLRGVHYVPNLKPIGKLLVTSQIDGSDVTSSYLVGVQDGRYWIATSMAAR